MKANIKQGVVIMNILIFKDDEISALDNKKMEEV